MGAGGDCDVQIEPGIIAQAKELQKEKRERYTRGVMIGPQFKSG